MEVSKRLGIVAEARRDDSQLRHESRRPPTIGLAIIAAMRIDMWSL
jgi:hypothetical protein